LMCRQRNYVPMKEEKILVALKKLHRWHLMAMVNVGKIT